MDYRWFADRLVHVFWSDNGEKVAMLRVRKFWFSVSLFMCSDYVIEKHTNILTFDDVIIRSFNISA